MNLKPGDVFANYVIQREIGRGGMGAIYLALDHQFDRHVAIKLMNPGLVHDPMFLERFRKEARIASSRIRTSCISIAMAKVRANCGWPCSSYRRAATPTACQPH